MLVFVFYRIQLLVCVLRMRRVRMTGNKWSMGNWWNANKFSFEKEEKFHFQLIENLFRKWLRVRQWNEMCSMLTALYRYLSFFLPFSLFYRPPTVVYCRRRRRHHLSYNIVFLIVTYGVPMLVMVVCYTIMGKVLWGSQSIGEHTQRQIESIKAKKKVCDLPSCIKLIYLFTRSFGLFYEFSMVYVYVCVSCVVLREHTTTIHHRITSLLIFMFCVSFYFCLIFYVFFLRSLLLHLWMYSAMLAMGLGLEAS